MEPLLQDDAPWKRRFRMPRVSVHFASCNPEHALVVSNKTGIFELYAYDLASDAPRRATNRPSGTVYGTISPDGGHIYYVDDKEGDETGHVVRVPFAGAGPPQDMTPGMPDYTLVEPTVDGTSSHMGLTVPGPSGFDSYVVDIRGGTPSEPRLLNRSSKTAAGPVFSHDGRVSVVISAERFGGLDYTLSSFDTRGGRKLKELADDYSRIDVAEFSPLQGDHRLLAMSNAAGVMRPLIWDAESGARTDLATEEVEGDLVGMGWSPDARSVLLCQTHRATTRLWAYDLGSASLSKVPHPEGTVTSACFRDGGSVLLSWQDSTHPTRVLLVDLQRPEREPKAYLVPGDVPRSHPLRSASFRSADGEPLQCWYATPEGEGPFPTILETHGGPTSVSLNAFAPRQQVWLDHGFAVASLNYRGSITFGKEFEKKINGDIGHWEVEDMVSARNWLVENRIARPDQIYLTGWSYGGYLTLQAMGVHPELWAGGMGGVVVADWITEYEDEPEAMKGYDVALHGGTPEEKHEEFRKASPISYVERLSAPVLIIQGKNDVRDPPRQVELYEAKARSLGKDVRVIWFDTGHAGSGIDVEMAITHHEAMLRWMQGVTSRHRG